MTEAFCIAITGTLLVSPYVTWYDSTLLALPLAVVFARSAMAMRVACVAVLVAVPLWRHGGGNNGPIGFMHVGVELLILAYFVHAALGSRSSLPTGLAATSRKLRGEVSGTDHLESSTRKPRVQMTESGEDSGGATAFTIALKDGSQRFATAAWVQRVLLRLPALVTALCDRATRSAVSGMDAVYRPASTLASPFF
jgi:hypothetical protein